jgi:hypothetical protein
MKQRNPNWGCPPRIAQQVALAFNIQIDKDVVRRILARHYQPEQHSDGPSWLTFLGHMKDSLWSIDLFRWESATFAVVLSPGGHGSIHEPHPWVRRQVQFVNANSLRVIGLNGHDSHSAVPVIRFQLLDALLVHLADGTVIAGEYDDQDWACSIVGKAVDFPIHSWQGEI